MRDQVAEAEIRPLGSEESLSDDDDFNTRCAFTDEELEEAKQAPDKAVTSKPPLLGYASTIFIIVNRMVGTGFFRSPSTIIQATHSVAWSLSFWALGGVLAVCGSHVFAELALAVPRLEVEEEGEQSVPRNGGEINYLQYYLGKHEMLATCLYGIPFIIAGTAAANCLIFAQSVLGANGQPPNDWAVRGVAIGVSAFACALHATWRKAGLVVNNTFGFIKSAILLAIVAVGLSYLGGALGGSTDTAVANLTPSGSMSHASTSVYGYAQSWLSILYTFGGFHQANYVFAEVKDCRRRFKVTSITTVTVVSIVFFLINLSIMFVVPKVRQFEDGNDSVAKDFFQILFGDYSGPRIHSAVLAFTSFGNIIVHTFTAARVKQEIAKAGVLPFSAIFARNYRLTPKFLRSNKSVGSEDTPAAAFLLHWSCSVLLILATVPAKQDSYRILVGVYSFITSAFFGFLVGAGLLYLRFKKDSGWSKISASNRYLSIGTATIYTLGNLFPLIGIWIPPGAHDAFLSVTKYWYTIGVVGVSLLGLGLVWWISLQYVIPELWGKELETDREYNFVKDHGSWVVWHEVVSIRWRSSQKME